MRWIRRLAYGCGQLLKDVVASVIGAFVIVYFQNCLGILPVHIGTLLLVGQVVNSISTPLVGFLSDQAVEYHNASKIGEYVEDSEHPRLGRRIKRFLKNRLSPDKRKCWHLWGSILMGLAFPTLFSLPEGFHTLSTWSKLVTTGVLLITIQIGWALLQIAHLTLLNYLTADPNERVLLVSLRYSFASIADISTLTLSYLLLLQGFGSPTTTEVSTTASWANQTESGNFTLVPVAGNTTTSGGDETTSNKLTPSDIPLFRNISLALTAIGMLTVVIFQCLVPEGKSDIQSDKINQNNEGRPEEIQDITRSHVHFIKSLEELHSISSQLHHVGLPRTIQSCDAVTEEIAEDPVKPVSLKYYTWFCIPRFWSCCAIFTGMRVATTLSLLYLSPFLLEVLKLDRTKIVLIPLISQCTGFVTTATQHMTTKILGRLSLKPEQIIMSNA